MPEVPNQGEKRTVLVVDDEPTSLATLNALLAGKYRVKVANDGVKALKLAGEAPQPDTILLDVMMPGIDGFEVCRRLKADRATSDIPVIFLTAKTENEDAERGFDAGGADYITKPILPRVVLARVETHVSLKVARDFLKRSAWT